MRRRRVDLGHDDVHGARAHVRHAGEVRDDAFLDAGLQLKKMVDVDHPNVAARRARGEEMPPGEQLPRFMVLAFAKP